jgi:nucleoside-diphosphate-sugar epimerase
MILAITGGTGFVGRHLIDRALAAGHQVRALTRRPQPPRDGVTWIEGGLDRPGPLALGADAVIHVAGIVNAPDRVGFVAGNVDGTRTILAAATEAGVERFVHVSSLSAREPQLSDYGWSKREAERLVEASALAWTIVRPTAIYGPGDMEMRDLFRAAKLGLAFLPPPGLMSAVEVSDLARFLLILAQRPDGGDTYEVDDGRAWTHVEFARALGAAVGRPVLPLHLPKPLMRVGARLDRLIRGAKAKLTPDRVGYLCHPDWSAAPDRRPPAAMWTPLVDTRAGLAATARWYRAHALL